MSVTELAVTASNNTGEVTLTMQAATLSNVSITGRFLDPDNSMALEVELRKTYNHLVTVYQQAVEREITRIQREIARGDTHV